MAGDEVEYSSNGMRIPDTTNVRERDKGKRNLDSLVGERNRGFQNPDRLRRERNEAMGVPGDSVGERSTEANNLRDLGGERSRRTEALGQRARGCGTRFRPFLRCFNGGVTEGKGVEEGENPRRSLVQRGRAGDSSRGRINSEVKLNRDGKEDGVRERKRGERGNPRREENPKSHQLQLAIDKNREIEANRNGKDGVREGKRKEGLNLGEERSREMEANRKGSDGVREERKQGEERENPRMMIVRGRDSQAPPEDDVCAICFGEFRIPCQTNCGHWYCANCILMFWKYNTSFVKRCKCPICSRTISKLTPEASLTLQREEEVVEALKSVQKYNCLFVGGACGLIMKLQQLLPPIRRFVGGLTDPYRLRINYITLRFIALLLACLYDYCGFDFIPTGHRTIYNVFDLSGMTLAFVLLWVGLCYRLVFALRARLMAALHP